MTRIKIEKHEENLRLLSKHYLSEEFFNKLKAANYTVAGLAVNTYLLRINYEYLAEFKNNSNILRKKYTQLKKDYGVDHFFVINCREQINQLRIEISNKQIVINRLSQILLELLE